MLDDLAIDMTSGLTVIAQDGEGIKINEPSLIIVDESDACLHVGNDANAIRGKTPSGVRVIEPITNGVIAEPEYAEKMLSYFLRDIYSRRNIMRLYPNILAVIPYHATAAERKIYEEVLDAAGSKDVSLIPSLLAGAYGAGLKVDACSASVICNISKNFTEVGLISMRKVHYASRVNIGYDDLIKAVMQYVKVETEFSIGEKSAEQAVEHLASALYFSDEDGGESVTVPGTIKRTSSPVEINLDKLAIHTSITPCVEAILLAVREVLEQAKDDMASDLIENGITVVGQGASLSKIGDAIESNTNIRTKIASNSKTCLAEGAAIVMSKIKN
ncbi:putative Cell shape-determining protein MreB [Vibrio chagasii]|nr:putative Cell shape-determining protein MreB [Vibrio chagasii]